MSTATPWRAVVEAARASRRADCGHRLSRRHDAFVWLRTQKVGSTTEVWSLCSTCKVEGQDYEYRFDLDRRPRRERIEYL